MRLFLAVLPDNGIKDELCFVQKRLQLQGVKGYFTTRENMHLTLAFIGEYSDPGFISEILREVTFDPIRLVIDGFGSFFFYLLDGGIGLLFDFRTDEIGRFMVRGFGSQAEFLAAEDPGIGDPFGGADQEIIDFLSLLRKDFFFGIGQTAGKKEDRAEKQVKDGHGAHQRMAAAPQVMPAPNAVRSRRSSLRTIPPRTISSRQIPMDAEEVLP